MSIHDRGGAVGGERGQGPRYCTPLALSILDITAPRRPFSTVRSEPPTDEVAE